MSWRRYALLALIVLLSSAMLGLGFAAGVRADPHTAIAQAVIQAVVAALVAVITVAASVEDFGLRRPRQPDDDDRPPRGHITIDADFPAGPEQGVGRAPARRVKDGPGGGYEPS